MPEYTREQREQIYEKLPGELQEAIFSVQTADTIRNACEKQGITDERAGRIAEQVGLVLMGLVTPDEFPLVLEQKIGLSKEVVSPLAHEINRFVFFPVKESLVQLHTIVPSKAPASTIPEPAPAPQPITQTETPKRGRPRKADAYKEQIDEE